MSIPSGRASAICTTCIRGIKPFSRTLRSRHWKTNKVGRSPRDRRTNSRLTTSRRKMMMVRKFFLAVAGVICAGAAVASPVAVDWKAGETAPAKVARPFAGFLPDGRFVVAGGSDFVDGKKVYRSGIYARELDGKWSKVGELPHPIAEGVCCETPKGIFCAGGTDGETVFTNTFEIIVNKLAEDGLGVVSRLRLPKPVKMGAAAYHDGLYFVIASKDVYGIDLKRGASRFVKIGEIPGPAREQIVAAVQNGDQKEKMLITI